MRFLPPYWLLYFCGLGMLTLLIATVIDIVAKLLPLNSTGSRLGLMIATSVILSSSSGTST